MRTIIFGILVIIGIISLGITIGDVLSSSVICDGSYWVHSSVLDQNETHGVNLFTTDHATVDRETRITNGVESSISASSSGVLGVDEYLNHLRNNGQLDTPLCVFDIQDLGSLNRDEVSVSGLLHNSTYVSSRSDEVNAKTLANTYINGSGLILIGKKSTNASAELNELASAHGRMSIFDSVKFGDE
ncbi:hypothetical protein [uncultured Methanospirillum sp.]|uniref:hypothetical protein n=1 Tax=uncultured Methanospirillum sp. TaxID=262503 RepID=UPI0029C85EB8|nr:hypothetical protein [uncultured Methanospirillum sp.]